ncbi:MAG: hypothetical protein WDM77_12080 [Steroidobacteraceae bacterium]
MSALIAIAESDDKTDPKAKDTLNAAFDSAGLTHNVKVFARHSTWLVPARHGRLQP